MDGTDEQRDVMPSPLSATDPADQVSLSASFDVDSSAEAVREARALLRETLLGWAVDATAANAALDVAHELMVNAVQHGLPPISLAVSCSPTLVSVVVVDGNLEPVRRLPYRPGVSERGLGVRLIAQLSSEWGQRAETNGKRVWAHIRRRRTSE